MDQKISVITVCFNCVNDISLTIDSVIQQSYGNIEYIIIDGGSTDGTVDVINGYIDNIDVFISEPDQGIFDAMNKGLKYITGDWVNFMNAGDQFYNSSVLQSLFLNKTYANIGVLYGSTFSHGAVRKPHALSSLKYGGIMACHQSIFYNPLICGKELFYKTKHKHYGDIELTRRLFLSGIQFIEVSNIISSFKGDGFSSQVSNKARLAKFDYLYQNLGLIGFIYGFIGKAKSFIKFYLSKM